MFNVQEEAFPVRQFGFIRQMRTDMRDWQKGPCGSEEKFSNLPTIEKLCGGHGAQMSVICLDPMDRDLSSLRLNSVAYVDPVIKSNEMMVQMVQKMSKNVII